MLAAFKKRDAAMLVSRVEVTLTASGCLDELPWAKLVMLYWDLC